MKYSYFFVICFILSQTLNAQVGIGTVSPDPSSMLDINSNEAGLLIPRMTQSDRDSIASPATGLLIFQTDNISGFYYYNGATWVPFSGGADSDWIISGNDIYNGNTDNVGIGTASPSSKLHIAGTTTIGSTGGSSTLYSNDFSAGTVTVISNSGNTCTTGLTVWNISTVDAFLTSCSTCSGDRAMIEYGTSCSQNQTLVEGTFIPTQSSIDISFNYGYNDFSASDSFIVTLYNETTSTVTATLLNLTADDEDATYTSSHTVVPGNNYSLHFTYIGDDDLGAIVDDILVTESSVASPSSYVFRLEDGQQQDGYVLTSDASGNATWEPSGGSGSGTDDQILSISGNQLSIEDGNSVTLPSGGGGSNTYENGLTLVGSTVRLGGTLTIDTDVDLDDNDLTFNTSSTAAFPGDIFFEGSSRDVMETNLDENYLNFGGGGAFVDTDDGTTFNDSGSTSYIKDFVAGFYSGGSGGSAIAMGSIEYFVDGTNELFYEGSGFSPMEDATSGFGNTLGKSGRRWAAVWANNGTIQTSDLRYKKDVAPLEYGLAELLKIKTFSYKWKNQKVGNTAIPEQLQEKHIGFSAQQLLTVIPESVSTHEWVPADENGNYKRIENDKLGVNYSNITPVLVNAVKEQQQQIEELKATIQILMKEIKELKKN